MPPEAVHTLDGTTLLDDRTTVLYGVRHDGELLAIGAIKQLEPGHVELKSMHTAASARRRGAGRALLDHLLAVAAAKGCERVSLETGSGDPFIAARSLYEAAGFVSCEAFGEHAPSAVNAFMTLRLDDQRPRLNAVQADSLARME
jgi:putative acetyltransferase